MAPAAPFRLPAAVALQHTAARLTIVNVTQIIFFIEFPLSRFVLRWRIAGGELRSLDRTLPDSSLLRPSRKANGVKPVMIGLLRQPAFGTVDPHSGLREPQNCKPATLASGRPMADTEVGVGMEQKLKVRRHFFKGQTAQVRD